MADHSNLPRQPPPARRRVASNPRAARSTSATRQHFEQHLTEMLRDERITRAPTPATRRPTGSRPPPSPARRQQRRVSRDIAADSSSPPTSHRVRRSRHSPPLPSMQPEYTSRIPKGDYDQQDTSYVSQQQQTAYRSPRPTVRSLATDSSGLAYLIEREPSCNSTTVPVPSTTDPSPQTTPQPALMQDRPPIPLLQPTFSALTGLESQQRGRPFIWQRRGKELRAEYLSGAEYAMVAGEMQRQEQERARIKREGRERLLREHEQEQERERTRVQRQQMMGSSSTAFGQRMGVGHGAPGMHGLAGGVQTASSAGSAGPAEGRDRRGSQRYWDTVLGRDE